MTSASGSPKYCGLPPGLYTTQYPASSPITEYTFVLSQIGSGNSGNSDPFNAIEELCSGVLHLLGHAHIVDTSYAPPSDTGSAWSNWDSNDPEFRCFQYTVQCVPPEPGSIIVKKQTDPEGATDTFDFTDDVESPNSFSLADGETKTFTNVLPGTYTITESGLPTGWSLTNIECDDDNSTGDVATATATINLEAGETVTCTFTNTAQTCTIIYGYKWNDYDHDGEWDMPGEPALKDWEVRLDGLVTDVAYTDAEGYYEFEVCTNGDYTASEVLLPGKWHQTSPLDPDTYTISVDVENGPYGPYNFGNAQTCTIIYGYKWYDYDRDGEWDKPIEPPLEDWEIHLDGPVTDVAYTDAEGYYEFTVCDLPVDTFTVSEVGQEGWTQTYPSAPDTYMFSVDVRNPPYGPYDFGNWRPWSSSHLVAVGGYIAPVSRLEVLAPWIMLAVLLAGGISWIALQRRSLGARGR